MEKTKAYRTLVKNTDLYGKVNPFILGKVSGVMFILCNHNENRYSCGYAIEEYDFGTIITVDTTEGLYNEFLDVVEKMYPGLCEEFESYDL